MMPGVFRLREWEVQGLKVQRVGGLESGEPESEGSKERESTEQEAQ